MKRVIIALIAAASLSACVNVSAEEEPATSGELRVREAEHMCDASDVADLIGQTADEAMGAVLLSRTGARTLRWVAPGMAVTMDYREDRLTVSYDDKMRIERITCG